MGETFDEALAGVKVGLVRANSGFYTEEIMGALEGRGLPYIIAAKAYANLKHEIHGMKDWVEICHGIAVKEWRHQPANPKSKARRHIVVRKQISRRPQAAGKLLFEDLPILGWRFPGFTCRPTGFLVGGEFGTHPSGVRLSSFFAFAGLFLLLCQGVQTADGIAGHVD